MTVPPYFSYFQNAFLTLVISRPNFRVLAQYTLDGLRQARAAGRIGAAFDPLIQGLADAIEQFDITLLQRNEPTAGDTEAFRLTRAAWLDFVLKQQNQVVNSALFGQPVLKDFRKFTAGKLGAMGQGALITKSDELVKLYQDNGTALKALYEHHNPTPAGETPETLAEKAARLVKAMRTAESARNTTEVALATSITVLAADWIKLALALRRVKGMLEVVFDTDHEVYAFFDFSKAKSPKSVRKADKAAAAATAATPPPPPAVQ